MKYIDAEKLKYEIERRNLSNYHTTTEGYEEELYEIIDSLQQEQPEVDLKKEIIRYQREDMDRDTTVGDVARHFYIEKWADLEENETVTDYTDLADEINRVSERYPEVSFAKLSRIAKHFAKWGAEHLKK